MLRDVLLILFLLLLGTVGGWFGHDYATKQNLVTRPESEINELLNPTQFPNLTELKLANFPTEQSIDTQIAAQTSEDSAGSIQILNAHAVTLYEEVAAVDSQGKPFDPAQGKQSTASAKKEYRMIGVRIMGEVKNIGSKVVKGILPSISFFDKSDKLLITKKGFANPATPFLPLEAQEVGGYDVIVREPPKEMEKIEVRLKAIEPEENIPWQSLKVKDKSLTGHKSGTGSAEINYYQFSGTLLNDSGETVESPTVLVWLKNKEGRVVITQSHTYTDDLLSPQKEMQASFLIRTASLIPNPVFEVRTFGKKYEK